MRLKEHEKNYRLSFCNGISIEILKREGGYGGLGQVKLRRRKLRSGELPVMPLLRTPDGYEVSRLGFENLQKGEECLTLDLTPYVRCSGPMEWPWGEGRDRWNVGPWEQPPERDRGGVVRVTIRALERTLGGVPFVGFSYAYKFRSRKYSLHRIHDRATWELGGRATGNSFWMAAPSCQPRKTVQNKADAYSTALCPAGGEGGPFQQFLPLFSALQGFTYQFDRRDLLVTAFAEPLHCRSLFHKAAGTNHLVHWHQLCGDLGGSLEFPALQVLVAEPPADETAHGNCYCAVREELYAGYAEKTGLRREPAVVASHLLLREAGHGEAAQRALDELARAGCQRAYVPGLIRRLAPEDGRGARAVGRAQRRAQECVDHAHHRGLELAASVADCCAPWLIRAAMDGQEPPEALRGGDGAGVLAAALCDETAQEALIEHFQRLKHSVGVDALFADDALADAARPFAWSRSERPEDGVPDPDQGPSRVRSLREGHLRLMKALQKIGYSCPLTGVEGLADPCARHPYAHVKGAEFMFRDRVLAFPYEDVVEADDEPVQAYFRGAANRLSYAFVYDAERGMGGRLARWCKPALAAINKAYHAVREHMERSLLLAEGRGVLWEGSDPDVRVLWSCAAFRWPLQEGAEAFEVIAGRPVETEEGALEAEPLRVYLLQTVEEF